MSGVKCTDNQTGKSYYTEREWLRIQSKEQEEKKKLRKLGIILGLLAAFTALLIFHVYYFVMRSHDYTLNLPYNRSDTVYGVQNLNLHSGTAASFAEDLCVTTGDVNTDQIPLAASSAGLFNLNQTEVEYAKDIFTQRSPASITKIMTALVALKYGNLDDQVTVTETAEDIEYGSSVCGIQVGDVLSLRQLIYGLMIPSGNDAAMMIAEHVAGSVDQFVALMNEEAAALGATDTHFTNPHGLTEEGHYTSVYDIYLMFNAAMEYDVFEDAISRTNYYAEYTRGDGSAVAVTWESTDWYFTGASEPPEGVTVFGGKTGTTEDAGNCLALMSKDLYGNPYLSIILDTDTKDSLYEEMNQLLSLIEN